MLLKTSTQKYLTDIHVIHAFLPMAVPMRRLKMWKWAENLQNPAFIGSRAEMFRWRTSGIMHGSKCLSGSSPGCLLLRVLLCISSTLPRLSHHRVSGALAQLWWLIALCEISLAFQLCIAYCCDIWFELQYCYSEKKKKSSNSADCMEVDRHQERLCNARNYELRCSFHPWGKVLCTVYQRF